VHTSRRLALLLGTAALVSGLSGGPARADEDSGQTTIYVEVDGAITLTDLTTSFTLSGAPGSTATSAPARMTVFTNNDAGYNVTVEPAGSFLTPSIPGNTDEIPTSSLTVRSEQALTFVPLRYGAPVLLLDNTSPSAAGGDTVFTTFRLAIPAVEQDTYSGLLTFVVTTL
jgi:hypothetical protein